MKNKLTKEELFLIKAVIKKRNSFKYARKPSLFMKFMSYTGLCFRGRNLHRFIKKENSYEPIYVVNILNPIIWCLFIPLFTIQLLILPLISRDTIIELFTQPFKYVYNIIKMKKIWYNGKLFI